MKLKRFGQFVDRINEDLREDEFDSPDEFHKELQAQEGHEDDEMMDHEDDEMMDHEDDEMMSHGEGEEEGEEEGDEYEGTQKIQQLSDALGVPAKGNQIEYKGHKINFYSENEMFNIGKEKFKTVEEVINFVKGGESEEVEEMSPDFDEETDIVESRKFVKRFGK